MRKISIAAGLAVIALAVAQSSGSSLLDNFNKALNGAKTLSATYKVTPIGGVARDVKVDLAKPNMARIDTPTELVVADGKTITTYDKAEKTYFKKPQTESELMGLFASIDTDLWKGFFDDSAMKNLPAKDAGTKKRKGVNYNVVEVNYNQHKSCTLYLDPSNGVARQAEVTLTQGSDKLMTSIVTDNLTLGGDSNSDMFAFKAPEGSREMSLAEMSAGKWYENLAEAEKVAKASGKLVMIDFYTDWCHWCKVLDAEVYPTKEFKEMGKYFIFCKIDAEKQESVAAPFNITGYPDIRFVKADGTQVHQILGYKPLNEFLEEMNKARAAGGLGN